MLEQKKNRVELAGGIKLTDKKKRFYKFLSSKGKKEIDVRGWLEVG